MNFIATSIATPAAASAGRKMARRRHANFICQIIQAVGALILFLIAAWLIVIAATHMLVFRHMLPI